ncbi:MAG: mannitol dehydrogenase family protein [Leptolyngbyaceae cyanobacterium CSU_1_4]|nr:mannitol dehydrogenase family protein [Leptolyngbyaceae cyanobacterium CSU_1_4]
MIDGRAECQVVLDLMMSATVHLVTLTVTQAGYYLDQSFKLNLSHDAIAHDLENPTTPITVIGFIVEAIRCRRDRGLAPFTTLSCDNLPRNGDILQAAVLTYAEQIDPQLAAYISQHATFPNTVVDRIVPRSQHSDPDYPTQLLQVSDRGPLVTEPFYQFVVEDHFTGDRPHWEIAGVTMTADITPYLYLKSRFLNALHSFVACLAVRAGISYVHEAIRLPEFQSFTQLLTQDITAATPVCDQMCEHYRSEVLLRLSNEALPDSIERIATETGRKVGKYIIPILQDAVCRRVNLSRLVLPIAAWILAVQEGAIESGKPYDAQETLSVVTAIKAGASLSQILGLEPSPDLALIDRHCQQALHDLQIHGLFSTLKHSCQDNPYDMDTAA